MNPVLRTAILTISDTASRDPAADKSGPTIRDLLHERQCECVDLIVVPDDVDEIRTAIKHWCSLGDVDWIITTGGTGFGVRDNTPEAISPLLDRHAPGLVHLLLRASLNHTPMGALSRPVAGTIGKTLVVTLPGSVKAVRENLDALFAGGVIFHAVDLNRGGSGLTVHRAMAAADVPRAGLGTQDEKQEHRHDHDHAHHHHHHEHHGHHAPVARTALAKDPSISASARQRESPYPLWDLNKAIGTVLAVLKSLPVVEVDVTPELAGHVLAEDVHAPADVPYTKTTNVDGYALRSTDQPGTYTVLTPSMHALTTTLPTGSIYRINTGAPLPVGADAVIMVEDTSLHVAGDDGEEHTVKTLAQVDAGENVRSPGSDVRAGELAAQVGDVVGALGGEIGTLAFVGRAKVRVHKKPVVAILSTGNEIVDLQTQPEGAPKSGWGGIWDTNRPSLHAALQGMGYAVLDLGIVPDSKPVLVAALKRGLEESDIVLTTGGTSMGVTDLLKPVLEGDFGGTVHFGRVKVKPGKPTTFATVPLPADGSSTPESAHVPVFALPGNPASALVMFYVFVVPALRRLSGWPLARCQLPRVPVQLQDPMALDPRPEFHRVVVKAGANGLRAYSTGGQRSSRVASLSGANALVALPARVDGGPARLEAGEFADALVIGELQMY